jgi:hypothetical protein
MPNKEKTANYKKQQRNWVHFLLKIHTPHQISLVKNTSLNTFLLIGENRRKQEKTVKNAKMEKKFA